MPLAACAAVFVDDRSDASLTVCCIAGPAPVVCNHTEMQVKMRLLFPEAFGFMEPKYVDRVCY